MSDEKLTNTGQAPAPEPETAPELQSTEIRMVVTPPDGLDLNLREGPAKTYAVLAQLPAKTEVTVVELPDGVQVPGWHLIRTEDGLGWVAAEYLQPAGD